MNVEDVRTMLAWSTVINSALFMWWFVMLMVARNWIYQVHSKWFSLSRETFDAIHYGCMALYKVLIITFNLAPYLALRLFAGS